MATVTQHPNPAPATTRPQTNLPSRPTLLEPIAKRTAASKTRALVWKVGLLAAAVALIGWAVKSYFFTENAQAAQITAPVTRAVLPITVTERGELESSKTLDVHCEVEGYQNKIVTLAAEGTRVKKGDVVVTFDTDQLKRNHDDQEVKWKQAEGKAKAAKGELEVQKNKAGTDTDKAVLALTLADLDLKQYVDGEYQVELDKIKGEIELARKDLQDAKDKLVHMRKFVKQGFGAPEQLRISELEVATKDYGLSSKEAGLRVLTKFTKLRKETELAAKAKDAKRELDRTQKSGQAAVDKAQSEMEAAEVSTRLERQSLDRLKRQLERCIVKAPQDGILVYSKERYWDSSSRIQPGGMIHYQQTLFSLPDLGKMQVKVKIHEAMVKKLKKGQKAEVRVDAYPDAVLHGTVESVATLADSNGPWDDRGVKEYVTIVTIDDLPADGGLKPGMTSEVKILCKDIPNVLLVPVQAVTQSEGKHVSYVVGARDIERREIEVGENNEKFVEIKNGLEEGEKVALNARARAAAETKSKEGKPEELPKPVTPTPEAAPAAAPAVIVVTPPSK